MKPLSEYTDVELKKELHDRQRKTERKTYMHVVSRTALPLAARIFSVCGKELNSPSRRRRVVDARTAICHAMRIKYGLSLWDLGHMTNRLHSNIVNLVGPRHRKAMQNESYRVDYDRLYDALPETLGELLRVAVPELEVNETHMTYCLREHVGGAMTYQVEAVGDMEDGAIKSLSSALHMEFSSALVSTCVVRCDEPVTNEFSVSILQTLTGAWCVETRLQLNMHDTSDNMRRMQETLTKIINETLR